MLDKINSLKEQEKMIMNKKHSFKNDAIHENKFKLNNKAKVQLHLNAQRNDSYSSNANRSSYNKCN